MFKEPVALFVCRHHTKLSFKGLLYTKKMRTFAP
jgi:hypothetical protein